MAFKQLGRQAVNRKASQPNSVLLRGNAAMDRSAQEQQEAIRRREEGPATRQPFRLWLPPDGSERELIILDEAPDTGLYEHCLLNPSTGRRDLYVPCIKEIQECPACRIQASPYVILLTVIDRQGYEDSKGNWHEWSRKIMAIKPSQQKRFIRQFEREGTLRGAVVIAIRNAQTDAAIGSEHEFNGYLAEEDLVEFVNVYESQGKQVEEDCSIPFDYDSVVKVYTQEEMERLLGLEPLPGSRRYNQQQTGARPAPQSTARAAGRGRQESHDQDTDGWDNDAPPEREPQSAPRNTSPRTTGRPATAAARPQQTSRATEQRPTTVRQQPAVPQRPAGRAPIAPVQGRAVQSRTAPAAAVRRPPAVAATTAASKVPAHTNDDYDDDIPF